MCTTAGPLRPLRGPPLFHWSRPSQGRWRAPCRQQRRHGRQPSRPLDRPSGMASPGTAPSTNTPHWPHCGMDSSPEDPVGCRGVQVDGYSGCLVHLADADRDVYLSGLGPGSDVDHRGTTFTGSLLSALLNALRDPSTGHPRIGTAQFAHAAFQNAPFRFASFRGSADFESATFRSSADFRSVTFQDPALFRSASFQNVTLFRDATFQSGAVFPSAVFEAEANFHHATFQSDAWFRDVVFRGIASFESAVIQGVANFRSATFRRHARFSDATFHNDAMYQSATFQTDAYFTRTVFQQVGTLGPLICTGNMHLSGALFGGPVTLMLAAYRVICHRTQWSSTAALRLRYASLDLSDAVFEYPLTISADASPWFLSDEGTMSEEPLASEFDASVQIDSLRGVDAAHLVLSGVDLSRCLFTGTVHLDQVRLEGSISFAEVPSGAYWRRWFPVRFSRRRTLAEERHWRAGQPGAVDGWGPARTGNSLIGLATSSSPVALTGNSPVGPAQLAPVYRALRKAFEDGKNEPGAADFYYGEMEMRRHDPKDTTPSERRLLHGYWAVSGYGLRAGRALGWLGAAMVATVAVMMLWGLPADDPRPVTTGRQSGQEIRLTTDTPDPVNPTGALQERVTTERFEKSLRVVINSVVFRSSEQDLTTVGTYTEMTSRIAEPVLLGLAVLAIRNRVKR
ncbi:pentapeptide repeat-containing protein [Streptomyces sp. NPDC005096]|uniref:pentapeptide repeat-containing protein n=1 Tax=Streptomyces sp. NPDC005096 TaxID=3154559 RepID=UPI0033ADF2EE